MLPHQNRIRGLRASRAIAVAVGLAFAALSAIVTGAEPASAQPIGAEPSVVDAVTLVTGHRASITTNADGSTGVVLVGPDGGDPGEFVTRSIGDDVYVIPYELLGRIDDGKLDAELFNVTGLVRQGYDDRSSETLPLIVRNAEPTDGAGVAVTDRLASLDGAAVVVDKTAAADAFAALTADDGADLWLDRKVMPTQDSDQAGTAFVPEVPLDPATGVEQTGAPEVWARGLTGDGVTVAVLDTGWDDEHPDLVGRVIDARNFMPNGTVDDTVGHGTHVAGTVAGDGSADPSKIGMAPGADLLIGRVLGLNGGQESDVIAGMEWAVESGADVINMSLGTPVPGNCEDSVAEAVERLADRAVFVIAAGNQYTRTSVNSPGCAESAVTVGAVDSNGEVANFSSRGATLGDHRIKPDLSAPGVAIVSAQAGRPGGIAYVAKSGTSMAAPHVAGAAALIIEAHPDWTPQQVKEALTASVKGNESSTVYEEGAGELWVPGAVDAVVTSDSSVELGVFEWPQNRGQDTSTTVNYHNRGDTPLRLNLRVDDVAGAGGQAIPAALVRVSPSSITVPAGGSVAVTVSARGDVGTLDPSAHGEVSARILATGTGAGGQGSQSAVTAVGLWLAPESVPVTVRIIDRNGATATSGVLDLVDRHNPGRAIQSINGNDPTFSLRTGDYYAAAYIRTVVDGQTTWSYVAQTDLTVGSDTTEIILDAREATPITVTTPRPMKVVGSQLATQLNWDRWQTSSSINSGSAALFAAPTRQVTYGDYGFATTIRGIEPDVKASAASYVYNLGFVETGRVAQRHEHRLAESDLATVTESWYGELGPLLMSDFMTMRPQGWETASVAGGTSVDAPFDRTAYYSPGVIWRQSASQFSRLPPALWYDPERVYEAGDTMDLPWFKVRSRVGTAYSADGSPARIAERQGTLIGFSFPQWQDVVPGRYAAAGLGEVGNTQIWVDGEYKGITAYPFLQTDIGPGTHEVRVLSTLLKLPRFGAAKLSSATLTYYTFTTDQPSGDTVVPLGTIVPRYDAPVDVLNQAPRDTAFPVTIGVVGQDGYDPEWAELSVRVSSKKFDWDFNNLPENDDSWVEVPVERRGDDWVALVDQSAAPVGSTISFAVDGTDQYGANVEQYLLDLYAIGE